MSFFFRYSNSEEKIWVKLCSAPYRDMYSLGLAEDALYLIGGQMKVHNHYIITDSVDRWSLKRGSSWLSFAPLPLALACHSTVNLKEHLYVLGGWTPQVQGGLNVLNIDVVLGPTKTKEKNMETHTKKTEQKKKQENNHSKC